MNIKAYAWDDEDYGGSYFAWTTHREKLKRYLLPNIIENLQKYGFIVFRGLINIGAWMIYQRKNFLKTVGIFIAQNAGHPFMTAPQ